MSKLARIYYGPHGYRMGLAGIKQQAGVETLSAVSLCCELTLDFANCPPRPMLQGSGWMVVLYNRW